MKRLITYLDNRAMVLKFVTHDIFSCGAQYIAHQCNCVTRKAKGLAAAVFAKYPHADTYSFPRGKRCRVPGTIEAFEPACETDPGVINCYAQCKPGGHDPPAERDEVWDPTVNPETAEKRVNWFKKCLEEITKIPGIRSVAFPHGIGCNLAGGDWPTHLRVLEEFANKHPDITMLVCRLSKEQNQYCNRWPHGAGQLPTHWKLPIQTRSSFNFVKTQDAGKDVSRALGNPIPKSPSFLPFESFSTHASDMPGASSAVNGPTLKDSNVFSSGQTAGTGGNYIAHVSVAAPSIADEDVKWYSNALTTGIPRLPQYPRSAWRAEKHRPKVNNGMQYCYNTFLDKVESFHERPFSLPKEWTHDHIDCAVARAVGKAERERSEKAQMALAKEWARLRSLRTWDEDAVEEAEGGVRCGGQLPLALRRVVHPPPLVVVPSLHLEPPRAEQRLVEQRLEQRERRRGRGRAVAAAGLPVLLRQRPPARPRLPLGNLVSE